jgi:hypothetical protein
VSKALVEALGVAIGLSGPTSSVASPGSANKPTLNSLSKVLPEYRARFDRTLAAATLAIGDHCDPANPAHAAALRVWLNKWLCRIHVPRPAEPDNFITSLAEWWASAEQQLPDESQTLAGLTDEQLRGIASAYGELENRTAAVNRKRASAHFRSDSNREGALLRATASGDGVGQSDLSSRRRSRGTGFP